MKKALGRWSQKAGESVGVVKRTTEVDEDFAKQEAATDCRKDVQEKLIRHLCPDSMKGGMSLFSKKDSTEEEKIGEFLIRSGNMLANSNESSIYASALVDLGEMFKRIGEHHKQTDQAIDERTIQPMKQFLETRMKELTQFKKRHENCRLDYEREKRVAEKKGETELFHQAARAYDESKEQYENAMTKLQESEDEQVESLQAYVNAQLQFHQKCVEAFQETSSVLSGKAEQASSRLQQSYSSPLPTSSSFGGDSSAYSAGLNPPPSMERRAPPLPAARSPIQTCTALYDFTGEGAGELSFSAGDVITITKMVSDEWAEGELWGNRGIFPVNHVQMQ